MQSHMFYIRFCFKKLIHLVKATKSHDNLCILDNLHFSGLLNEQQCQKTPGCSWDFELDDCRIFKESDKTTTTPKVTTILTTPKTTTITTTPKVTTTQTTPKTTTITTTPKVTITITTTPKTNTLITDTTSVKTTLDTTSSISTTTTTNYIPLSTTTTTTTTALTTTTKSQKKKKVRWTFPPEGEKKMFGFMNS
jgi:hypothetical protein